ncbi:MAG: 6-pyruvoyl-tetrahydropterin synthase-related protein [Myxococcota bacterium]|nr:6-pyruvoyl-tetrahydropterin synthase-related protein [Myxococcota bacterium]
MSSASTIHRRWHAGSIAWGLLLAIWLGRVFFLHDPDWIHLTHENVRIRSYSGRLLEFRDLLAAGYWSPQWATHFHKGFGTPYFGYYQPGIFYLSSLVPWSLAPMRAFGVSVVVLAWLGYAATYFLVRRWFGGLSGAFSGSLLLLSVYACTEIYLRGDFSEFAAMMLFPAALCALAAWVEDGKPSRIALLAVVAGALPVTHPAIGLVGYGVLGMLAVGLLATPHRARAVGALAALGVGVGLSAFYWMPVFLEWDLVSSSRAFTGFYDHSKHFVDVFALVGPYTRETPVPFTLGPLLPALVAINLVTGIVRRRRLDRAQSMAVVLAVAALVSMVFLMTEASAFVWAQLVPLQRLQFPWRLLALATVFAACLAGAMLPWPSERLRGAVLALVVGVALFTSQTYSRYTENSNAPKLPDVAAIEAFDFDPAGALEWMPLGAELRAVDLFESIPRAAPGARVESFERTQGRLRARVESVSSSSVVFPHFAFSVGWTATLGGAPIEIGQTSLGLMRFELPAGSNGVLEARFSMTPMRAAGLRVSAAAAVVGVAVLLAARRRSSANAERS